MNETELRAWRRIARFKARRPNAVALARLVCPATRIETRLLRRLRRQLLPNADVGTEADLWHGPLTESRGVDSIVLNREATALLRADLQQEPALLARVLDEIEATHTHLPGTLRLEERLTRLALQGAESDVIEDALRPALRTLRSGGEAARSVAHWALRALPRAEPKVRATAAARAIALQALVYVGRRRLLPEDRLEGASLADIAWAVPESMLTDLVELGVELIPNGLRFVASTHRLLALRLPRTMPLLVEASWSIAETAHRVLFEAAPGKEHELRGDVGALTLRTLAGDEYVLERQATAVTAAAMQKTCYVIMGFGKKIDPSTGRTLDLDHTYSNIIKPTLEAAGFTCQRGDEISSFQPSRSAAHVRLLEADLVIADLSASVPNTFYELGISYGLRPRGTIVIAEAEFRSFLNHHPIHINHYLYRGPDLAEEEMLGSREDLTKELLAVEQKLEADSVVYAAVRDLYPPQIGKVPAAPTLSLASDLGVKPNCLVLTAHGKKTESPNSRIFDLDKVYDVIIRPAVESAGFICQQADLLDSSACYLAMHEAPLVVANLTTANPNVLLELGIRHALRPSGTILIAERESGIPFCLSAEKVLRYEDFGAGGSKIAAVFRKKLTRLCLDLHEGPKIDSPVYVNTPWLVPPSRVSPPASAAPAREHSEAWSVPSQGDDPTTRVTIREAQRSDLDALVALEHAAFASAQRERRAVRHAITSPSLTLLVALVDEASAEPVIVGAARIGRRRGGRSARLISIAVAPNRGGLGIGGKLLDAAENRARDHGCDRLRLDARADNAAAIRLYERRGYTRIAVWPDFYEDGMDAWRYEKYLGT